MNVPHSSFRPSPLHGAEPSIAAPLAAQFRGCDRAPLAGVLFDMGDVLYDATVWRRWLIQVLGRLGMTTHYRAFFRVWDEEFLDDVHRGRREYSEAFASFLRGMGLSCGQVDEVEAAALAQRRLLGQQARPFPGVRSALGRLREAQIPLAVVSDSESRGAELEGFLARLGLAGMFDAVVSSIDLGRTKPDPVCYLTALHQLQLDASRVAFVGHDAVELAGARSLGLRTIAFNPEPEAVADVVLTRFDDLPQVVRSWPAVGRAA